MKYITQHTCNIIIMNDNFDKYKIYEAILYQSNQS